MDNFGENFNLSNPNFTFVGNKENELIEEMGFKLKNFDKKRLPEKKMFAKRKNTETLDVDEKPLLSKSVSYDSIASRFPVVNTQDDVKSNSCVDSSSATRYHPVMNSLSPKPQYLMFSPDRFLKSASYDCVMLLSDEELVSSVCSVEETRLVTDKSVDTGEETEEVTDQLVDNDEEAEEIIDKSVDTGEEMGEVDDQLVDNVEETDEIIGDLDKDEEFEDENGWSLKVLLKWLLVMIVLILTSLTISSVDSPMPSPVREAIRGCKDLFSKSNRGSGFRFREVFNVISVRNYDYEECDKKDLVVDGDELVEMRHEQIEDAREDEAESKEKRSEKVENAEIDVDPDDIWNKKDSGQFQESTWGRVLFSRFYKKTEASKYIEGEENEENKMDIFSPLQVIDSNENDVMEDVEGKEDDNDHGLIKNEIESVKTVQFDPISKALIGISLLIFASSSVLYYSMQTEISSLEESPKNEVSNESSSITSYDQSTGDSRSHGSFTIEKIFLKKQKSKTPESTISKVRRSSRIHNRYVTLSP